MVGINGEIIAEPNDPNHIKLGEGKNATNGYLPFYMPELFGDKVLSFPNNTNQIMLTKDTSGVIVGLPFSTKKNQYLCTDANGYLIFKEL